MALTKSDLIGIIVVPGLLAVAFVLLAVFYFIRHWILKILVCFWKRDLCLVCKTERCEKLMDEENEGNIYVTDSQLLDDSEKSVPHTLSVELVTGTPCSGRDRSNNV